MESATNVAEPEATAFERRSQQIEQDPIGRNPLVSCLCVTRERVGLLRRAVACFLNQSYSPRELLIVYGVDDNATRDFIRTLNSPSIRCVEAPPRLLLGASRNLAMASSRGFYVAQWDDDDWHAPGRLAEQIAALEHGGRSGCVLERLTLFDMANEQAHLSHRRSWEGSLVARRDSVPPFPELAREEDTPVIEQMGKQGKLVLLDRPELYVYVYHGRNTWDRKHWDGFLLRWSQLLPEEISRQVMARLGSDDSAEWVGRRIAASAAAHSERTWIDKARNFVARLCRTSHLHDPYGEFINQSARQVLAMPDNTISLLSGRKFLDLQPRLFQTVRQGQARFGMPSHKVHDDLKAACYNQRRHLVQTLCSWAVRVVKYHALLLRLLAGAMTILPRIDRKMETKAVRRPSAEARVQSSGCPRDTAAPLAAIVVLSFNRLIYLRNTLTALWATVGDLRYELIVVDNGSQDGSAEFLKDMHRQGHVSKLVLLDENLGISAGYNLGFAVADARSEHFVKLDSDIQILSHGWLHEAIAFLAANRDVAFVALNQVNHGYVRVLPRLHVGGSAVMDFAGWPCGSAIVIPRRVKRELGCFVEDAKLTYVPDDIDYYVRASRRGYRVFFLRNVMAYHQGILDRSTYRVYSEGKPRGASAELALKLARDYDRGDRPLELNYEKYGNLIMPEDGILAPGSVFLPQGVSSPASGKGPERVSQPLVAFPRLEVSL